MGESIQPNTVQSSFRRTPRHKQTPDRSHTPDTSAAQLDVARRAAVLVFGDPASRDFAVRYWDSGQIDLPGRASVPVFTLTLTTPAALRTLLLPPSQLRMAQAFCSGVIEVDGDLIAATDMGAALRQRLSRPQVWRELYPLLRQLPHNIVQTEPSTEHRQGINWHWRHSKARDASAVRSHYDLSNDFYRLWLDERMVYSCAYFDEGVHDINAAQTAKLHHILRKVRLSPGDRLLDIGCGWGGLVLLAAREYGVHAVGVTLSPEQAAEARARIAAAGLQDRCRVEVQDYRALPTGEPFDRIVSVGMCEHVGRGHLGEYFTQIQRLLRPGGLFLNHCLTEGRSSASWLGRHLWRDGVFLDRYVFPDSELPLLAELVSHGRDAGLEARDVEQLREHYVRTVRAWLERLSARREEALRMVDPWTYNAWRLYLAASAAGLSAGRMELTQILYAMPDAGGVVHHVPATRRDLYQ